MKVFVVDFKMSDILRNPFKSCSRCKVRLNTLKLDSHVLCITCRGKNCSITDRCEVCSEWSDGDMNTYVKHMARLERKTANIQS